MTYRITTGIVFRDTEKAVFPPKNHQEESIEALHKWLTEYAKEWAGMPQPPPVEVIQSMIEQEWDEDMGFGEIAFLINVLGENYPQVLKVNILAHN
jgi:hypothetical protein